MRLPQWAHFTLSTYMQHPLFALAMLLVIVAAGGAALFHLLTQPADVSLPRSVVPSMSPHKHRAPASKVPSPRVTTPGP